MPVVAPCRGIYSIGRSVGWLPVRRAAKHQFHLTEHGARKTICAGSNNDVDGRNGLTGCQSGASAVEFALVLPLLFFLFCGILVFGSYLSLVHSVQQLAAEAARASVAGMSNTERATLAMSYLGRAIDQYPMVEQKYLTARAAPESGNENIFTVTVTYDAGHSAAFIFSGLIPLPSRTITRSAAIQRGGY